VLEGQLLEVQQASVCDLAASTQVEVLEGQLLLEVQQASVCDLTATKTSLGAGGAAA
jgi:hypothetical protein